MRGEASIGVSRYTNASCLFEGMASTCVSWYTNVSPLFLIFSYKLPPPPPQTLLENSCRNLIGKKIEQSQKKKEKKEERERDPKNPWKIENIF